MTKDSADEFDYLLRVMAQNLPTATREYKFSDQGRWRFDFAWPEQRVAVEVDGGQWVAHGGRHNRDRDRRKLNRAAAEGWRVLRVTPQMLKTDPWVVLQDLEEALGC